ncbi:MAG TPA: hypothetical protein VFP64_12455 [Pyrinomonadaceae bacterium]|nr:hypothetical protein [Pyrinomonadaceae bacterium]
MKSTCRFVILIIICISVFSVGGRTSLSYQDDSIKPPDDLRCGGMGRDYLVWGTVVNSNQLPITDGSVEVQLHRAKSTEATTWTDAKGRYCIRYSAGKAVTSLAFISLNTAFAVEYIAGNQSHIINKVLYKRLATVSHHASAMDSGVTKSRYGPSVERIFFAVQTDMVNISDTDLKVLAAGIDRPQTKPAESDLPYSADPKFVAQVAEKDASPSSILRIGPIGIITLHKSRTDVITNIYADSLRVNEVLPRNQTVRKVVFIPKDFFGPGKNAAGNIDSMTDALSRFRVVVSRIETIETTTLTN